ncbi:rho guanine nucleotide exchange factor 18 isoform X4 [Episyrphus balteatus]|uniref:rho guanine nucleotide exchange factor 18 isoform X4 n=1 Tax=Episyrphus balteatus TaxID=286459 RepID=UPI0024861114|nr:rho guanine nucleotide exchange factor 18 isoform X4 [Episyrphus balteatus]
MDIISTERLMPSSGEDDSDVDLVTDFLSANGSTDAGGACGGPCMIEGALNNGKPTTSSNLNSSRGGDTIPMSSSSNNSKQNNIQKLNNITQYQPHSLPPSQPPPPPPPNLHTAPATGAPPPQAPPHIIPAINTPPITNNINMVPIISVTPHSPGAKYNSILEDTLIQLQNIRESVVQMKNSTVHMQGFPNNYSLVNSAVLSSSRLFSSCPSLPDLTAATGNCNIWSPQQYLINSDRRKSWTAIEDLTECTNKSSHKSSVSLSSLDSEEQESIRVAERHRSSRNSTGGISTHSLNEAELARDFERIAAKRNLAPALISRIPLQKSISTPSIAPLRIPSAKEENNITTSRHLSDSEDDNQDDRSLLCVHDKTEVYDHPEKRRKRGSLFFRKKKDKTKTKGQSTNCDACGVVINLATVKDHQFECKGKTTQKQSSKSNSGKKGSLNSHTSHHDDGRDYYDGHSQNEHSNYSDDTPLIRVEFLNEPPIGPHDLGADPALGIALDEHDSWSPSVPKEVVKSLKDKQQVKRQEHIYEFIMTEKHHCQTLLVMQKVFVESLERHFAGLHINRMFPRLAELTELHTCFLKKLRQKQRENYIVDSIADILVDFFSSTNAQRLKVAYGEFCSNHRSALDKFKFCMTSDQTFAEWYKHCLSNPLLKKKGIPECILFVTQRLTKYPLLIDPLLKSSREDRVEQEKLQRAMNLVKSMLVDVDACVAEKEKQDRQLEIFRRIDVKSYAMYKNKQFRKSEICVGPQRRLKFEGYAMLMQGRSKMQVVLVVVLSDCLFFLQESSHNKYTFFTPENKAGVVSLQKLLIREKAGTESRGIYIISSNPAFPEMYELKVQQPKDKNVWIQAIRAAVLECPSDDIETDDLTAEEKQKLIDAKQANMRELIAMGNSELEDKMRQKDIEQALILEEKILLQLSLLKEKRPESTIPSAEAFLSNFGTYRDLINDDCDTIEIWKRVLNTVQEIYLLASTLYTAATGLSVSRSTSSVGEKQSDAYASPILPKRAETFGGFDEKRSKSAFSCRDVVLSTLPMSPIPCRDNHHLKESSLSISASNHSEYDSNLNSLSVQQSAILRNNTENICLKDNNYAALQVSHYLQTLLCIVSQQMTTIQNLQMQLASFRDNPKTQYKHNDQLEELRNLQDKLQEEKTSWLKQKEQQERDLEEQKAAQEALQKQIKAEQEDIRQQREQLYRKMELLSSQGLLLSPSTPLPIATIAPSSTDENHPPHSSGDEHHSVDGSTVDRRKDKWRSASTVPKTPPANLLSATNAPKVNPASVKQQIPMKLSSLSSTKSEKSPQSTNSSNNITSPPNSSNNSSGGITQMFPLKLADKKNQMTPNHSRTGSSPAIIQQQPQQTGNPATRTNTYPKLPERYRLRNSDVGLPTSTLPTSLANYHPSSTTTGRNVSAYASINPSSPPPIVSRSSPSNTMLTQKLSTASTCSTSSSASTVSNSSSNNSRQTLTNSGGAIEKKKTTIPQQQQQHSSPPDEEEIYF